MLPLVVYSLVWLYSGTNIGWVRLSHMHLCAAESLLDEV